MKVKAVTVALIVILALGVWWGLNTVRASKVNQAQQANAANSPGSANSGSVTAPASASSGGVPQLDSQGGVEVEVTWEKEKSNSQMYTFLVAMSNHMIDLSSFDLANNVELNLNGKPVQVAARVLSKDGEGHHVTEEIGVQSQQLSELKQGTQFTLVIENLAGVSVHDFTWRD